MSGQFGQVLFGFLSHSLVDVHADLFLNIQLHDQKFSSESRTVQLFDD